MYKRLHRGGKKIATIMKKEIIVAMVEKQNISLRFCGYLVLTVALVNRDDYFLQS